MPITWDPLPERWDFNAGQTAGSANDRVETNTDGPIKKLRPRYSSDARPTTLTQPFETVSDVKDLFTFYTANKATVWEMTDPVTDEVDIEWRFLAKPQAIRERINLWRVRISVERLP